MTNKAIDLTYNNAAQLDLLTQALASTVMRLVAFLELGGNHGKKSEQ